MKPFLLFAAFFVLLLLFVFGAALQTPGFIETANRVLERGGDAPLAPESTSDSGARSPADVPVGLPTGGNPQIESAIRWHQAAEPSSAQFPAYSARPLAAMPTGQPTADPAARPGSVSASGGNEIRLPPVGSRRPSIKMPPPPRSAAPSSPSSASSSRNSGADVTSAPTDSRPPPRAVEAAFAMVEQIHAPGGSSTRGVDAVNGLVGIYQRMHRGEVPPVMDNQGLVRALSGDNPANLQFLPPADETPAINEDGLLVDRWGTPFALHLESSRELEIRSAGPDKELWTFDDLSTQ